MCGMKFQSCPQVGWSSASQIGNHKLAARSGTELGSRFYDTTACTEQGSSQFQIWALPDGTRIEDTSKFRSVRTELGSGLQHELQGSWCRSAFPFLHVNITVFHTSSVIHKSSVTFLVTLVFSDRIFSSFACYVRASIGIYR